MSTSNVHLQCGNLLFSCILSISLWAKCLVPKSAGVFHISVFFAMVSFRRATASCTHKTWEWRCLFRLPRVLTRSPSTLCTSTRLRGVTTFAMSAAMDTAPRAVDALLINASHSVSPEHVPPRFELLLTRQWDDRPASRTKAKSPLGSSDTPPSRCPSGRPQLTVQLVCCTQTKLLGLPFRNRTKRLSACMFLVFGCCIRLASSFTANYSSHLSWLRWLARIVHDR